MKTNEVRADPEWMKKARRIGTIIRVGAENFVGAVFICEGLMIALSMMLIILGVLTNPEAFFAISLKNWLLGIGLTIYCYLISVMCYNAGIEHFPKLHPYKAPAPRILKRISVYIHDHMIVMKSYRSR